MKLYVVGYNEESTTGGKVIVTVELLDDMCIQHTATRHMVSPFYFQCTVSSGRFVDIQNVSETESYNTCTLYIYTQAGAGTVEITKGKYFKVNSAYEFPMYVHKIAACEAAEYVCDNFSGSAYRHYSTGNIQSKSDYCDGTLYTKKIYRDDAYNTLQRCIIHRDGKIFCQLEYSEAETLQSTQWYNSDGTVYATNVLKGTISNYAVNDIPTKETKDIQEPNDPPTKGGTKMTIAVNDKNICNQMSF